MKISYDSKYDVLYIKVIEGESEVATRHLAEDIALDVDGAGHLVGLEVLSASEHIELAQLLPVKVGQP
jgi:uncharacterized protein YuzE